MSHSSITTAPDARRARGAGLLLAALASSLLVGCAETLPRPDSPPVPPPASISAADNQEAALAGARPPAAKRVLDALFGEAKRYVFDAAAFVRAPAAWDASDWRLAAGAGASLGTLLIADESIDGFARRQRSRFTDRVSGATTWIGGGGGFDIPFVLLAGGLALSDANTRDMGRDSLEACLFAGLLTRGVKRVAGRERPFETDGETSFKPLTSHDSFPSAHTTQAFAIASVVAMRSEGWVVPALAYTAASVVAFDRVNDRVHFASDVAAGALVGTVVGRFLVARHRREDAGLRRVDLEILPLRSGLAARLRF
jgi:membrane-associated phospholipid phosphatase